MAARSKPKRTRRPRARVGPSRETRIEPPSDTPFIHRVLHPEDLYYRLLTITWATLFGMMAACYVVFNAVFALFYELQPGSIENARRGFADAFFFSVQTMATIGYGDMRPATFYANLLVSVEVLFGLMGFAMATGIIFARFSRPTARMLFSKVAVVARYEGRPTLMIRAANRRANRILEADASVVVARNEVTAEGVAIRRLRELSLERRRSPLFTLSWTVMHPIDAKSPLHGVDAETLVADEMELILTIVGIDETLSQTVHGRHVYRAHEILFGRRFSDILTRDASGATVVDYRLFHDTIPFPH